APPAWVASPSRGSGGTPPSGRASRGRWRAGGWPRRCGRRRSGRRATGRAPFASGLAAPAGVAGRQDGRLVGEVAAGGQVGSAVLGQPWVWLSARRKARKSSAPKGTGARLLPRLRAWSSRPAADGAVAGRASGAGRRRRGGDVAVRRLGPATGVARPA